MKRLFIFAIVVATAWYGYQKYPELMHRAPRHEAVVENRTGHPLERVRVGVGGQTLVREQLAPGGTAVLPFRVDADSPFGLTWQYGDAVGEFQWKGGLVTAGPIVQRHVMTISTGGGVTYQARAIPPK